MTHVSVVIPHRNSAELLAVKIFQLRAVLGRHVAGSTQGEPAETPFEIVVVDDGSDEANLRQVRGLVAKHGDFVRAIRLQQAAGISAAITAGIAAANGEEIVVLEPGDDYPVDCVPDLLGALKRADVVFARPQRSGFAKIMHRLTRIPRWLLLGLEVRDPDCVFWAARKEAVAGLELVRGMYRYLATFVTARGFRVSEATINAPARRPRLSDGWPNPGDLLAAWWSSRRCCRVVAEELSPEQNVKGTGFRRRSA